MQRKRLKYEPDFDFPQLLSLNLLANVDPYSNYL